MNIEELPRLTLIFWQLKGGQTGLLNNFETHSAKKTFNFGKHLLPRKIMDLALGLRALRLQLVRSLVRQQHDRFLIL